MTDAVRERTADLVRASVRDGVAISISSQVAPEIREYERTSTTVANAYVQPLMARYLIGLFATTSLGRDPRRQKLIAAVLDDFRRLSGRLETGEHEARGGEGEG